MKTRLGLWIAAAAVVIATATAWGCGTSPDLITNPPADPTATPVTAVTPIHLARTPTPNCRNFKLCQDQ